MPASNETTRVAIKDIKVPANRQRKEIKDVHSLADSIRRIGLLHPLIVTRDLTLVAGERRLKAWQSINEHEQVLSIKTYETIPVHFLDQLDPRELRIVELDENVRRQDITWQEQVNAIAEIHSLLAESNQVWSQASTADRVGLSAGAVSKYLEIAEAAKEDKRIFSAPTINSARATVKRNQDRKAQDAANALSDLVKSGLSESDINSAMQEELPLGESIATDFDMGVATVPASDSILNVDAIKFMSQYSGPRFSVLHCDFPYGINYDGWDKSAEYQGGYEDDPSTYFELLKALANFWDNMMLPNAHMVFWFSMRFYHETMQFFEQKIPQLTVDEFPLVWLKSDNKGTLPDPNRGPRRVYETALFGYTGDRKIVKPVSNGFGAPTQKSQAIHISEKPEQVLKYFLSMVVDEGTTLFDPTCGSGSSLRAGESLGAKHVLGLELDEGYANAARKRLEEFRTIRSLEGKK